MDVTHDRNKSVDGAAPGVVPWHSGAGMRRGPSRTGAERMKRTIAAANRAHVPGRARPCDLGTWYVQPEPASGAVFMTAATRRPSERPT
jgi:hypothetical protein